VILKGFDENLSDVETRIGQGPGPASIERKELPMNRLSVSLLVFCTILFSASPAFAEQEKKDPNSKGNLIDAPLEELMEIPVVVSASRQAQKSGQASAAVSVITAEDIHYSGATNIPEILQFVPGVDVQRLDRQRYIVGVRGLLGTYSDRTLVLIDGRPAMDPIFGTTYWENLPIMMEDIERIEVVRGPAGAAWGANAFTGVINIITKKPSSLQGGLASTTVSQFGDTSTQLRYAQTEGQWSWKVSGGYDDVKDSETAGAGKYISGQPALNSLMRFNGFEARDWGRYGKFDTQAEYRQDKQTRWSFGAAHSSGQQGDYEFIGVFPQRNILTEYTRMFARMDYEFDKDTTAYIQWFGDYMNRHCRVVTDKTTYMENDLEGQFTFKPADDHTVSVGGNLRWNRMTARNHSSTDEIEFDKSRYDEYWAGLFMMDRWAVTDRFTLEGQVRLDNYSETKTDWSARMTALYALDDKNDHTLRASFARSFRSPSVATRTASSSYLQVPYLGGLFIAEPPADKTLKNEGTYSLEAGYTGRLAESLTLDIDAYYQRMEDLIGVRNSTNMFGVTTSRLQNVNGADSWGGETSLTWRCQAGKISGWYAYNVMKTDESNQLLRALPPSTQKTGLTARWYLDKDWTFNTNYVFQNGIQVRNNSVLDLHNSNQLDLTLSRKIADGKGELMVGVADVLNKTVHAVTDTGSFTGLETPGRTVFARLQLTF
jgi:outer membrane receptor for ferrienterochelin and colicin